ncbi:MAG: AbrB/MazE/SpoVT family DNA-binding domain-containing protein [Candidatus Methanoperedens sp.]|nr:AbrB/MazE/SpoVT family DNA-binding domain-containing protein [Candidatus Methanoperedens sp.]
MERKLQHIKGSHFAYIPKGIIEHFGLKVGDRLDFRIEGDHIKAVPVAQSAKNVLQAAQHPADSIGGGNELFNSNL